jgi:hypothetical protein
MIFRGAEIKDLQAWQPPKPSLATKMGLEQVFFLFYSHYTQILTVLKLYFYSAV